MRVLPNYCHSFRQEAHQVWHDMSEAEGFNLPRNEETTTEELLLSLARKHKGRGLEIKAYTKKEEGKNGADWAFWFANGAWNGIGARIQAKRLFADDGAYSSLYHQSKKQKEASKASGKLTPNQCETLLNYKDGLVPMYLFYNSDQLELNSALSFHTHLAWWKLCGFPYFSTDWGISAASALAIKHANWGKDNSPGQFPMIPWHCIVCGCCWDDRPADPSLPSLVGHGLRQLYGYSLGDGDDDRAALSDLEFSFEPTDNVPKWVGLLREGSDSEGRLDEEMDRLNLRGIAVIEETEAVDE
ncbi:DUF6615 family protein [Sulfitobacter sp. M368]|uniref:DUF6615 family protein n=1 Tax=Sulfitobacter sp. M368 TaxID=2867021 RepID=UPI0021A2C88B|nr:DUF6615 family protein [Sulfitobacter sp. M368]UWR15598.1 hypothetical protein K3754_01465 [Sulfitobacter sp. M368]